MEIIRTPIEDLLIFRPRPVRDEHGYFSRKPLTFRFSLMLGSTRRVSKGEPIAGPIRACAAEYTAGPALARQGAMLPQVSPAGEHSRAQT